MSISLIWKSCWHGSLKSALSSLSSIWRWAAGAAWLGSIWISLACFATCLAYSIQPTFTFSPLHYIQFNQLSLSHPPYIIFNFPQFLIFFSSTVTKPHQNDQKTWHALFISFISMHCNGQGFTILSLFEGLYLGCDPPFNRGKPHSISRSRKVWIPWKVVNLCRSHIVQAEDQH